MRVDGGSDEAPQRQSQRGEAAESCSQTRQRAVRPRHERADAGENQNDPGKRDPFHDEGPSERLEKPFIRDPAGGVISLAVHPFDGDRGRADRARRFGSRTFQSNQPQWAICRKNHASFPFALFARCFAQPDRAVGHRSRRSAQWWLQRLAHANRERRSRGSRCGPRPAHTGARPHLSTEGGVFWLNRRLNSSLTARNFSVSLGSSR
jgi:hypothetical protein